LDLITQLAAEGGAILVSGAAGVQREGGPNGGRPAMTSDAIGVAAGGKVPSGVVGQGGFWQGDNDEAQ
jgi:hypothetical protein